MADILPGGIDRSFIFILLIRLIVSIKMLQFRLLVTARQFKIQIQLNYGLQ